VNFVDRFGLENVSLVFIDMHDEDWAENEIGYSKKKIKEIGCYLAGFSEVVTALTDEEKNPDDINGKNSSFVEGSGSMNPEQAASNYGLEYDYWTRRVQVDLGIKLDALNAEETKYGVLAQIPYNAAGDTHWVGVSGGTTTFIEEGAQTYVKVTGTSQNDYNEFSRPENWIYDNGDVYIPTSEILQIHTFKKNK